MLRRSRIELSTLQPICRSLGFKQLNIYNIVIIHPKGIVVAEKLLHI